MPNIKKLYFSASTQILSESIQAELKARFNTLNGQYGYFLTDIEKDEALQEFVTYYKLFSELQKSEGSNTVSLSPEELYKRTYSATVLFGGQGIRNGINTIDKLINDLNNGSETPLNQSIDTLFSNLLITPKSKGLDLAFWRSLINGQQSKRALQLFAVSSSIFDKFGTDSQGGYSLALTKTYPTPKNTRPGILYLYKNKKLDKFGYAFKNANGVLISGTIEPSALSFSSNLNTAFDDKSWNGGERKPDFVDNTQQETLFSLVSESSSELVFRLRTVLDMEEYYAKMLYNRFIESPELALFCSRYKIANHVFNRCLDLLKKPKKHDSMPDIYINGADCGHEGYHLLKLPANDYHAFFLGYIVNCCQSMGRAAEQVVLDGWSMSNRGFYVLVKEHKPVKGRTPSRSDLLNPKLATIIGQGYAWRSDYYNIVIDSWDNLMKEHDGIADIMLRKFADQIVSDPQYKAFRVTVGASGGKTPPTLKTKLAKEPEVTSQGLHHKDSKKQAEIEARNIKHWELALTKLLEPLTTLSDQKKQELIQLKQMSVYYHKMLRNLLSNPVSTDYLNKQTPPMDNLMALFVLLRSQPETFNLLINSVLKAIPEQHLNTHRMRINILLLSRLIIGASLQKSPTLLKEATALLKVTNSLNADEVEQLFIKLQDTKSSSFLMACAINQPLLDEILSKLSNKTLHALILEKRTGKNIFHDTADKPELFKKLLATLPEKNRVEAIDKRGRNDKPLLHYAIETPESIRIILNTYPKETRLATVQQVFGGERNTVMHLAMKHPESFRVMLDCLADSEERLAAVSKRNKLGETVLTHALQDPALLKIIEHYLPEQAPKPVFDSIKQLQGKTITSNRFIFWETVSKVVKDEAIKSKLNNLNLSLVSGDETQIRNNFDALCSAACLKRNQFSALIMGKYSTETQSAKYLITEFNKNEKLLQALSIDIKGNQEQRLEQIQRRMLSACPEEEQCFPKL